MTYKSSSLISIFEFLFEERKPEKQKVFLRFPYLSMLLEGRLEDIKSKLSGNGLKAFEEVIELQQSETYKKILPKYYDWIATRYAANPEALLRYDTYDFFLLVIMFDQAVSSGILNNSGVSLPSKDIYFYKSVDDLDSAMFEVSHVIKQKEKEKKNEKDFTVIHKDTKWLVVQPHTTEASCKLGTDTRWCISAKEDNYFENYTNRGVHFIFVMDKEKIKRDPYSKIAVGFIDKYTGSEDSLAGNYEIYDSTDSNVTIEDLVQKLPPQLLDIINKFFDNPRGFNRYPSKEGEAPSVRKIPNLTLPKNQSEIEQSIQEIPPGTFSKGIMKMLGRWESDEQIEDNIEDPSQREPHIRASHSIIPWVESKFRYATVPQIKTLIEALLAETPNYFTEYKDSNSVPPEFVPLLKQTIVKKMYEILGTNNPTVEQQLISLYEDFGLNEHAIEQLDILVKTNHEENSLFYDPAYFNEKLSDSSTSPSYVKFLAKKNRELLARTIGYPVRPDFDISEIVLYEPQILSLYNIGDVLKEDGFTNFFQSDAKFQRFIMKHEFRKMFPNVDDPEMLIHYGGTLVNFMLKNPRTIMQKYAASVQHPFSVFNPGAL